jgi:hypothetical protein
MKYAATFERTKHMHMGPTSKLVTAGQRLMHHYRNIGCIDIQLTPISDGEPIDKPIVIYQCMPYIRKFNMASHIKVELEAELDESKLEEIANAIGALFDVNQD